MTETETAHLHMTQQVSSIGSHATTTRQAVSEQYLRSEDKDHKRTGLTYAYFVYQIIESQRSTGKKKIKVLVRSGAKTVIK